VRRSLDPTPEVRVDGKTVASETLVSIIGAHAVAVSTTIAALPAQLHSAYLGDPAVDTQIAEVRLAPHVGRESLTRSVSALALPVTHEPLRALYDHLQRLQDMLAGALGTEVSIDLSEAACTSFAELALREHA
jgi:hypothetical protein